MIKSGSNQYSVELSKKRDNFVDALKGFAILLVVMGHLDARHGKSLFPVLITLRDIIYTFHMPLFMIISGYLFAKTSDINSENFKYGRFIYQKAKRLLLPYISISILILVAKFITTPYYSLTTPLSRHALVNLIVNPRLSYATLLWYIYTLFLIFTITPLLLRKARFSLVLILACLFFFCRLPSLFCIDYVGRYLIFFLLGFGFFPGENGFKLNVEVGFIASIAIFLSLLFIKTSTNMVFSNIVLKLLLAIAGSSSSMFLILVVGKYYKGIFAVLCEMGIASASIYLLHTLSMGFTKIVLDNFMSKNISTFLIGALLVIISGIIFPILLNKYFFKRYSKISLLVLGNKVDTVY